MKSCENCRAAAMDWCDENNKRKCLDSNLSLWLPDKGVCSCGEPGKERYSLGIYAGTFCDQCWKESGFRDEDFAAFNPMDAGEEW